MPTKSPQKKAGRPKKVAAVDLSRWTILVPWETRIAVTKAAERNAVNLNEWINEALLNEARGVLTGKREIAKPEDVMDVVKGMADLLAELKHKVDESNKPLWKRIF
jgi:hypothetical protein